MPTSFVGKDLTSLLPGRSDVPAGLATAGPPMVRSLLAELIVMLAGTATSILALRQFCVFALVAVIVDFVLQISFFVTVLSIDIRRLEVRRFSDLCLRVAAPPPARPVRG